jgi:hypothetical protein
MPIREWQGVYREPKEEEDKGLSIWRTCREPC